MQNSNAQNSVGHLADHTKKQKFLDLAIQIARFERT